MLETKILEEVEQVKNPFIGITADLESYGFKSGRMKTGTPPRVDGRSLDYSVMEDSQEIKIQESLVIYKLSTL